MSTLVLLGDLAPVGLDTITIERDDHTDDALVLANLETPLCDPQIPARPKAGPSLRADPKVIRSLATAFPNLAVSLANNHTMDYGTAGLQETLTACRRHGIGTFGAGDNLAAARAPKQFRCGSKEVVVVGICERQFGIASHTSPGVAPFLLGVVHDIRMLREIADYVIVSVHGASEMSPWPAPKWQESLRALSDAGVDIVHGHHAHVPQGFERRENRWIVYGAGNTVVNPNYWREGGRTHKSWRYVFDLDQIDAPPQVSQWILTSSSACAATLSRTSIDDSYMDACNSPLKDAQLLEGLWQENAMYLWNTFYADGLRWRNASSDRTLRIRRHLRGIARDTLVALGLKKDTRDQQLFTYHLFACEHHAEAIVTALALQSGEICDCRNQTTRDLAAAWLPGWTSTNP